MENRNDLPVDEIDRAGRLVEPSTAIDETINRNLQLGNVKHGEIRWLHMLESTCKTIENFPVHMGGDLIEKWGRKLREEKNHFLVLSGSKEGFVRKMEKTMISKQDLKSKQEEGKANNFFGKKKQSREDEY